MAGPLLALLPSLLPLVGDVLDRVVPDREAAAKARVEVEMKLLEAATVQASMQAQINQTEAQHPSIWVAGWRPFIGWVCGAGLAWAFIVGPLASWALVAAGGAAIPPVHTEYLFELVVAMLGIGGLRTLEKMKGVAR